MRDLDQPAYHVIPIPTDVDAATFEKARATLKPFLSEPHAQIALDLSTTGHIYSAGISLIIRLLKEVQAAKGSLSLVNINDEITKILRSVRLDKILPMYRTIEEFEIETGLMDEEMAGPQTLEADLQEGPAGQTVVLSGSLNTMEANNSLREIARRLEEMPPRTVLDFTGIAMVDSQCVGILIQMARTIQERRGRMAIAGANRLITDLFVNVLELEDLFSFFSSPDEARKNLLEPKG